MPETRLDDLRRRVRDDPASLAFAPLAEECRRAGALDEAIRICRAGLRHHPEYLSARVTLGRALLERGALDDAAAELGHVLAAAPENLAALKALADLHRARGEVLAALDLYRQARMVAPADVDVLAAEAELARAAAPAAPPDPGPRGAGHEAIARLERWLRAILERRAADGRTGSR